MVRVQKYGPLKIAHNLRRPIAPTVRDDFWPPAPIVKHFCCKNATAISRANRTNDLLSEPSTDLLITRSLLCKCIRTSDNVVIECSERDKCACTCPVLTTNDNGAIANGYLHHT